MKAAKCSDLQGPSEEYILVSERETTPRKGVLFRARSADQKKRWVEDRGISESKVESERLEGRR